MTPGARVRLIREGKGWSPEQLAKACAMRPQFLLQIEAGEVPKVHLRTWQKLADVLDVSADDFFTESDVDFGERDIVRESPEELRPLVLLVVRLVVVLGAFLFISLVIFLASLTIELIFRI